MLRCHDGKKYQKDVEQPYKQTVNKVWQVFSDIGLFDIFFDICCHRGNEAFKSS
jgi:hypothetical protein